MKSFENINILIKVKLFCKKKFFFQKRKKTFLEKTLKKKNFFRKKLVLVKKNFFLKKKTRFGLFGKKIFFEKIIKNFFYLWRLKVSAHKSPGA